MVIVKSIVLFILTWLKVMFDFLKSRLLADIGKDLEIIALRSQLALFKKEMLAGKISKPRFTPAYRMLWVMLSKIYSNWKSSLLVVKPETVIGWHKKAFKFFWMFKSRKRGSPMVSQKTIALIKRIHKENPLLSPEKIYERLVALSVTDAPCPNTIAKYIPKIRKIPTEKQKQSWMTFLKNHIKGIWAMDFFIVPTITFTVLYVLVIISHDRRKIKHFAVTENPHPEWIIQQIREATPYNEVPEYMIHDNDSTFTSRDVQRFLSICDIKSKRTSYRSPWQNGICERVIKTIRQELLNHVIPFNENHLYSLLKEYINDYYNPERTHQAINCESPISSEKPKATKIDDTVLNSKAVLGGLYHNYKKVA